MLVVFKKPLFWILLLTLPIVYAGDWTYSPSGITVNVFDATADTLVNGSANISYDGGFLWFNLSCEDITGSADLCDGSDADSAGSPDTSAYWQLVNATDYYDGRTGRWVLANFTDAHNAASHSYINNCTVDMSCDPIFYDSEFNAVVINRTLDEIGDEANRSLINYIDELNASQQAWVEAQGYGTGSGADWFTELDYFYLYNNSGDLTFNDSKLVGLSGVDVFKGDTFCTQNKTNVSGSCLGLTLNSLSDGYCGWSACTFEFSGRAFETDMTTYAQNNHTGAGSDDDYLWMNYSIPTGVDEDKSLLYFIYEVPSTGNKVMVTEPVSASADYVKGNYILWGIRGNRNVAGAIIFNSLVFRATSGDVTYALTNDMANESLKVFDEGVLWYRGNDTYFSFDSDWGDDRYVQSTDLSSYQIESSAYKESNFTSNYDARTDRFLVANWTTLFNGRLSDLWELDNFTSAYDARTDRYDKENLTIDYVNLDLDSTDDWNWANNASEQNDTMKAYVDLLNSSQQAWVEAQGYGTSTAQGLWIDNGTYISPNSTYAADVMISGVMNVSSGVFAIGSWKINVTASQIDVYIGEDRQAILESDGKWRIAGDIIVGDNTV